MDQKQPADHTTTDALITLLDIGDTMPGAADLRARSYELLHITPQTAVVDVGCGPGRAAGEMADKGARSVGIDPNERMITVARERWPAADFRLADAYELPFDDAELQGYRAEKVYHVLDDPARAISEARRVLAPGGRIVILGQDWDTFIIDSDDTALTRTIVHARADLVTAPRVVRRCRNLLLDAGFTDVTVEIRTAVFTDATMLPVLADLAEKARSHGAITDTQAKTWLTEQQERAHQNRLFFALPLFTTAATRP